MRRDLLAKSFLAGSIALAGVSLFGCQGDNNNPNGQGYNNQGGNPSSGGNASDQGTLKNNGANPGSGTNSGMNNANNSQ
jgi:hypothetical protein